MSLISNLRHRCTIQRSESTTTDDYDHAVPNYQPHLTDVRCRLIVKEEKVAVSELAERPILTAYHLMVAPRTDVQTSDQISNIVFEDGSRDAGPYRIEEVLPRRSRRKHHLTLKLEKVYGQSG